MIIKKYFVIFLYPNKTFYLKPELKSWRYENKRINKEHFYFFIFCVRESCHGVLIVTIAKYCKSQRKNPQWSYSTWEWCINNFWTSYTLLQCHYTSMLVSILYEKKIIRNYTCTC